MLDTGKLRKLSYEHIWDTDSLIGEMGDALREAADEVDRLRELLKQCREVGERDIVRLIDGSGLLG